MTGQPQMLGKARIDRLRRRVVRGLSSAPLPIQGMFARRRQSLFAAQLGVRVLYVVALFQVCDADNLQRVLDATTLDPLWCVRWVNLTSPVLAGSIVYAATVLSAIACVLAPERRPARIAFAAALLEFGGLQNSFGKINHNWHVLSVCAFLLCFLPSRVRGPAEHRPAERKATELDWIRGSTGRMQAYLLCVWSLLASFFLTYTISGSWKVAVGLVQAAKGEPNAFSPSALAYHVARRLVETGDSTPLAHVLLRHPAWGWPASLLTLYLETFALVAAFRPRLHRPWAMGLIAFHLGSGLVLDIGFYHHVLLLGVLGLCSPFAPAFDARTVLLDLPLFGDAWRWLSARRRPAPRAGETPLADKTT